ncbi:MAG: hypothetical protein PHU23_04855, partial [Dehalococcoidales bacterium]|nr:hypothetical protein [Dehalococcoidales bacterium]
ANNGGVPDCKVGIIPWEVRQDIQNEMLGFFRHGKGIATKVKCYYSKFCLDPVERDHRPDRARTIGGIVLSTTSEQ